MTIAEILEKEGEITYRTKGTSMEPMLRENRDVVVIRKKGNDRAAKHDVVLYTRPNLNDYVLHRVIAVEKDGYTMMGDHQYVKERHVPESAVLGILTSYIRDGKEIPATDPEYLRYVRSLTDSSAIRYVKLFARRAVSKIRRTFKKDGK